MALCDLLEVGTSVFRELRHADKAWQALTHKSNISFQDVLFTATPSLFVARQSPAIRHCPYILELYTNLARIMPPFNLLHSLSQDVSRWVDSPLRNLAVNQQDTTPTTTTLYAAVATATPTISFPVAHSSAPVIALFQRFMRYISHLRLPLALPALELPTCMLLPMGSPRKPASCMFLSASDVPILCAASVVVFLAAFRLFAGRYAVRRLFLVFITVFSFSSLGKCVQATTF